MASLLDSVSAGADFSIFATLLGFAEAPEGTAALADLLDDTDAEITLFAPSNAAFIQAATTFGFTGADADTAAFLIDALTAVADANDLSLGGLIDAVLRYHVVTGDLAEAGRITLTTLGGQDLVIDFNEGVLIDNDPATPDAEFSTPSALDNGTLRIIDAVLLPQATVTDGAEVFIGTALADSVVTGSGDDLIATGGGADTVRSGAGDDSVTSGAGNDRVFGQNGDDTLRGFGGDDRLYGQNGDDSLDGGDGRDFLDGGAGNDTLSGGADRDVARGDSGDDLIETGFGSDLAFGGAGNDTILGDRGRDHIFGQSGNDSLTGGSQRDILFGGGGADVIEGDGGSDFIRGGTGNDTVDGGQGDDLIFGGGGNDSLDGGTNDDTIEGGTGHDRLNGQNGDDRLLGDSGGDTIDAGDGNDTVYGGEGDDAISGDRGDDSIIGGTGDDTVFLTYSAGDLDTIFGGNNNGNVFDEAADGFDVLDMSGSSQGWTFASDGTATSGDHTVVTGEFNKLIGSAFADDLSENGPSETSFIDQIYAGAGDDIVRLNKGGSQLDIVDGGDGIDTLDISLQNDGRTVYLSTGFLSGHRLASNFENVIAGNGDDNVFGTDGANRFDLGAGDDTVTGDDGADVFVFHADGGTKTITDFDLSEDQIVFDTDGYGASSASFDVSATPGELHLFGDGIETTVILQGLTGDDLDSADILFL